MNTSACENCPVNCKKCSSSTNCITCFDGYSIVNNDCILTSSIEITSPDPEINNNSFTCDTAGLFWETESSCGNCMNGCAVCDNAETCVQCSKGFFYNGTQCINCQNNCIICKNLENCLKCGNGYIYINSICIKYEEFIESFEISSENNDSSNNSPDSTNTTPVSISVPIPVPNPSTTSTHSVSNIINNEHTEFSSIATSLSSLTLCSVSKLGVCLSCKPTFFYSNGKCSPCIPNCMKCVSPNTCKKCIDGYKLLIKDDITYCTKIIKVNISMN